MLRSSRLSLSIAFLLTGIVAPLSADEPGALPLRKVVLFNSGIGFYEHRGQVSGDAVVDMRFNVDDVNDLLKSLVPQDLDGGQVSTVTYGSQDPITKTLKTFAIDLTTNPTIADLLGQVRGEKVEIETSKKVTGTIVGIERRKRAVKDEILEEEFLNLLADGGFTSVPLTSVQSIRLANPKLDAELRQALEVLAMGHANDKKTVSLKFLGQGRRNVRVGYVQESPIWKTSYRLVLSDEEALLQGWAVVENTTEEDWNDVELSLVSGRPISFVMNLYQPLYVSRPVVEPELFASLRPQRYGQDMAAKEQEFAAKRDAESDRFAFGADARRKSAAAAPPAPAAAKGEAMNGLALARNRGLAEYRADGSLADEKAKQMSNAMRESVRSAAEAADVGEMFQYVIDSPVTLGRQKSALLPIVVEKVKGDKVSIYNAAVHAKHPLNGLKLVNSTKLHLMQGPITVFDDEAYAGDAQIEDLPPGSERLVSYAMDLDVEVTTSGKQTPNEIIALKLARGVLQITNRYERELKYVVKNSGKKTKQVLIEQPLDDSWKLLEPQKPAEKTRDRYRFQVAAAPGVTSELKVREEQSGTTQVAITGIDTGALAIYMKSKHMSEAMRKAIQEVQTRQAKISNLRNQITTRDQQVKVIEKEQERIRQNMNQLDRTSDLYLRYVKKFSEQEDEVEKLRGEQKELQSQLDAEQRSLQDFVTNLSAE